MGITPACAGKRGSGFSLRHQSEDHPRVCGEKGHPFRIPTAPPGSPPRVRGKVFNKLANGEPARITPACAGKSRTAGRGRRHYRDHPRVCGEKSIPGHPHTSRMGSPPRVRGKGVKDLLTWLCIGITPACAGKRLGAGPLLYRCWDHPRVCGEKVRRDAPAGGALGSPPRVRGKEPQEGIQCAAHGITPACAGKRLKRSHRIGHFSCILCLFHSVLHRASVSGGSRAGPCAPPCLPAQNAVPV